MGQTLEPWRSPQKTQSRGTDAVVLPFKDQLNNMNLDDKKAVHVLFTARAKLLDNTQLQMPYVENTRYYFLISELQRTLYNPHFRCDDLFDAERSLKNALSDLGRILREHVFVKSERADDFFKDIVGRLRPMYTTCFFTGMKLTFVRYIRLVPRVSHPCNFVPVCDWFRGTAIRGVVNDLTAPTALGTNGQGQVWLAEHGMQAILRLAGDLQPYQDTEATRTDDSGRLWPRTTTRGWIARTVLMLIDMYGSSVIAEDWVSKELLVAWATLPLSIEEVVHDLLVYTISNDSNPFIGLSSAERERYARSILQRDKSENDRKDTRNVPAWRVITALKGYIARDRKGLSRVVFEGDKPDEPGLARAIQQFESKLVTLDPEVGGAVGLP